MDEIRQKLIVIGGRARLAGSAILAALFALNYYQPFSQSYSYTLLIAAVYSLLAGLWAQPLVRKYGRHLTPILLAHFAVDLGFVCYMTNELGTQWHYHVYAISSLTIVFTGLVDRPVASLYMAAECFVIYLVAIVLFPSFRDGGPLKLVLDSLFVAGYLAMIGMISFSAKRTLDSLTEERMRSSVALEKANAQLRLRMIDLARSDRYKSEFLHMVSHELRTPLNSIIGFSELMLKGLEGPVSPAQREDLESIHRSGKYLLAIVNDILDMAKIQSGDLRLNPERCDVTSLARESAEVLVPAYASKGLSLEISGPSGGTTPAVVEADPARVRQVFFNLLSNAVKFTDHGGVRVTLNHEDDRVICAVSDTGRGIPSDRIEEVFDPFKQVDSTLNRKHTGTGLGLPIAKRLVELHGGNIRVRSQVGRGTTFEFSLPKMLPAEAPRR